MKPDLEKLDSLKLELQPFGATLVAVSKTRPSGDIKSVYDHGHRDFGENYVQELMVKQPGFPADLQWHFIGHLQSNKVKLIAPFVSLIHGVDSIQLATEISKHAVRNNRIIEILLQVHIAVEEEKFGLSVEEAKLLGTQLVNEPLPGLKVRGLMGMASFSDAHRQVKNEFKSLRNVFDSIIENIEPEQQLSFTVLSMGMSNDYRLALEEGSTMVRIGSAIFGERN